jgi:hypothetical protein
VTGQDSHSLVPGSNWLARFRKPLSCASVFLSGVGDSLARIGNALISRSE